MLRKREMPDRVGRDAGGRCFCRGDARLAVSAECEEDRQMEMTSDCSVERRCFAKTVRDRQCLLCDRLAEQG